MSFYPPVPFIPKLSLPKVKERFRLFFVLTLKFEAFFSKIKKAPVQTAVQLVKDMFPDLGTGFGKFEIFYIFLRFDC